jgi:ketosteroid isomerase-like protein
MEEHPNVAILRRVSEAMSGGGDVEAAVDPYIADDIEWYEIGRSEPTVGKEALRQRYQQSMGSFDIKVDEHDTIANDTHAVQLMNVTATKDGRTLNYRTAEIYHMKDGKITARWAFSDDTARILEFFGS